MQLVREFAKHNPILGTIPGNELSIDLTDTKPVRQLPIPIPTKLYQRTKAEIQRLENLGIIRKNHSEYACTAFPILKRNGDIRLIVDYRPLNAKTVKLAHPFPNLWYELRNIPKSKIFTQLDLSMGYHQVKIDENSIRYTSFVTSFG